MTTFSDKDNVSTALADLRQTLEDEKERLNKEGAQAMNEGEYATAAAVIQFAQRLLAFQSEVDVLIGKWEELDDVADTSSPSARKLVTSHVSQSSPPAARSRTLRSRTGLSDAEVHCFYILETLAEKGGRAPNQTVPDAVNKKIKMLYPAFKRAKELMAQQGWTNNIGSNQALEISAKGMRWLETQQARVTNDANGSHSAHSPPSSRFEKVAITSIEPESGNRAIKPVALALEDDEDFDQI